MTYVTDGTCRVVQSWASLRRLTSNGDLREAPFSQAWYMIPSEIHKETEVSHRR